MERPVVSALIVSRRRLSRVRACIAGVLRQDYPSIDIHVLANGCAETAQQVRDEFPDVDLVELPENVGSAWGRNRVTEQARGELLLYLDDDGELRAPDIVSKCVDAAQADPRVGIVSMGLLHAMSDEPTGWRRTLGQLPYACYHASFAGGACLMRAQAFRDAGGYSTGFTGPSEEFDLTVRMYAAGWAVLHFPEVFFHHHVEKEDEDWRALVSLGYCHLQYVIWRLYPSPWARWASWKALATQLYIDLRHHAGRHLGEEWRGAREWAARGRRDRDPLPVEALERMYFAKYYRVNDWDTVEQAPSGLLRRLLWLRIRRKVQRLPKLPLGSRR